MKIPIRLSVSNIRTDFEEVRMRERKLKRALWLDRAKRAKAIKWHEGLERYLQERKSGGLLGSVL